LQFDVSEKLPFNNLTIDALYSSHVIEHLTNIQAFKILKDVHRILKKDGLIRIVTPDLEGIVLKYLEKLHDVRQGKLNSEDEYQWMLLELLDQEVRDYRAGEMGVFLKNPNLKIHKFIRTRLGPGVEEYWGIVQPKYQFWCKLRNVHPKLIMQHARNLIAKFLVRCVAGSVAAEAFEIGIFRKSGEVHLWLYDQYSLAKLLTDAGFTNIKFCSANESRIPNFNEYGLDIVNGEIYKPNSLYIEGVKS
jgi:hypothetical protein